MPAALDPVPQAPSDSIPPYASHPPFATHRASLHAWFLTQLHAMRPSSAQFSAQCPKRLLPRPQYPRRSQHPAHHASRRRRHPTHRIPSACGILPTMPPDARSIRATAPQTPTALARAPAASIPRYARCSQFAARRFAWLPGMDPSCISCIKPRHANYLQYQRYARQAPIALHASAPQARATFRSWAPRSLMALRAFAPWRSTTFHASRSAPQAPPHSSRACVFRFGAGRVPVKPTGHRNARPAEPRPGLFSRYPNQHPPRPLPHRSRR